MALIAQLRAELAVLRKLVNVSRDAFSAQTETIRQTLFACGVMASDETMARVGKKNWQLWVLHYSTMTTASCSS
jgi:hypothetical protein